MLRRVCGARSGNVRCESKELIICNGGVPTLFRKVTAHRSNYKCVGGISPVNYIECITVLMIKAAEDEVAPADDAVRGRAEKSHGYH